MLSFRRTRSAEFRYLVESVLRAHHWGFFYDEVQCDFKRLGFGLSSGHAMRVCCRLRVAGRTVHTRELMAKRTPWASLEYEGLRTVRSRTQVLSVLESIPEPWGLLEDSNIIITDFFSSGRHLANELVRPRLASFFSSRPSLSGSLAAVGCWLARFQNAIDRGDRVRLTAELHDIGIRLDEMPGLSTSEKTRILAVLRQADSALGLVRGTLSHGDFAPRNVLMVNGEVKVIDWEMARSNLRPLGFDYHFFVLTLAKRQLDRLVDRGSMRAAQEAFEAGYRARTRFARDLDETWKPTRLLALVTIASRQTRLSRRRPLIAKLSAQHRYLNFLVKEMQTEL